MKFREVLDKMKFAGLIDLQQIGGSSYVKRVPKACNGGTIEPAATHWGFSVEEWDAQSHLHDYNKGSR